MLTRLELIEARVEAIQNLANQLNTLQTSLPTTTVMRDVLTLLTSKRGPCYHYRKTPPKDDGSLSASQAIYVFKLARWHQGCTTWYPGLFTPSELEEQHCSLDTFAMLLCGGKSVSGMRYAKAFGYTN